MSDIENKPVFGETETYTPLNPSNESLTSDELISNVLKAGNGGADTARYFDQCNSLALLYQQIAEKDENAWSEDEDDEGNKVLTISMLDGNGETLYMKLAIEGFTVDDKGRVEESGEPFKIGTTEYKRIATLTHTVGFSNFTFSKSCRSVGQVAIEGALGIKILPFIFKGLKIMANAIVQGIKAVWALLSGGGAVAGAVEGVVVNAAARGEIELGLEGLAAGVGDGAVAVAGDAAAVVAGDAAAVVVGDAAVVVAGDAAAVVAGDVAVGEVAAVVGGITTGTVFVVAAVVVGVALIGASFVLHNSFHKLRIWNLTQYNMDWSYWFDSQIGSDEGKIVSGPGTVEDGSLKPYRIAGARSKRTIPGVKPSPAVSYGDIEVMSSHEYNGIGYVLQLFLKDQKTDETVYTVTVYYDIPWTGENSTNLTFDNVSKVDTWYRKNQGNNKKVSASTASLDKRILATSTYDYLKGEHGIPSQGGMKSSNQGYYYQSMLNILQPGLKIDDLR